ncbi:unnamed protein product [Meloidogyne enterolobii]|uniref:Uncharacterized protein n=1 Tax=Meloidogyne enterolobii TaxID=390850 RepID=A0ACB1AEZ4_MELEN
MASLFSLLSWRLLFKFLSRCLISPFSLSYLLSLLLWPRGVSSLVAPLSIPSFACKILLFISSCLAELTKGKNIIL